jgi:hypothetical protein
MMRALHGGQQLTRQELKVVLQRAGIRAEGVQRLAHLVMQAELDAVICSGARRGKHFTYALLDDRVPASKSISRDDALAELARRYFSSHGPAQLQDFTWWSGLRVGDARAGLEMVERDLAHDVVNGRTYWFATSARVRTAGRSAYLLPLYDEFLIAYRDRSAALDASRWTRKTLRDPFSAPIVVGGKVVGGWRSTIKRDRVIVTLTPYLSLNKTSTAAVAEAARTYSNFIGLDLEIAWV